MFFKCQAVLLTHSLTEVKQIGLEHKGKVITVGILYDKKISAKSQIQMF